MPLSDANNLTPILKEVMRLNPTSILDLGCGVGVYGVLCRQYLDIQAGRLHPEEWLKIICGVEGFKDYANPCWDMYTTVETADFSTKDELERYKGFDLVLMIDSLEHLDGATGSMVLDWLLSNNKQVIVSCPTGSGYLQQGAVNGNEFERHRHEWVPADMEIRGGRIISTDGPCFVASIPRFKE